MFTGLVERIGTLLEKRTTALVLDVAGLEERLRPGDSLAVNGVCLTATRISGRRVTVDVSAETLSRTTLGGQITGARVNLETALTLDRPLGGHFLQGHVDGVGEVTAVRRASDSWTLEVAFPQEFARLVVSKGSLGVDGVSLTVAELEPAAVHIAVIPHTIRQTIIPDYATGRRVNLEFDILGKYVLRYLESVGETDDDSLSFGQLHDLGY
ncbi:MAG: riboflavin synthase [Acidobacteria bacterium]|nr:riboflavin synthase [Acidobacteriota bacterium]